MSWTFNYNYNICKHIKRMWEIKNMVLEGIMTGYGKCKKYEIGKDVIEYLHYVERQFLSFTKKYVCTKLMRIK